MWCVGIAREDKRVTVRTTNVQPVLGRECRAKQNAASAKWAVLLHSPHSVPVFSEHRAGGSCGRDEGPDSWHRQPYDLEGSASSKELQPPLSILVNPPLHRHRRTPGLEVSVTTEVRRTSQVAHGRFLKALLFMSANLDDDSERSLGFHT